MVLMIPNIYKGDYGLFAIPPLILIIISLLLIPSIEMGVDFQGGTLVTLSLDERIDGDTLQAQLQQEGVEAKVSVFETAVGYRVEIEVPQDEDLIRAEELKYEFNELLPEVSQLEVLAYQNTSYQEEYVAQRTQLENISDQLFSIVGFKRSEMNITSTNDLERKFSEAYSRTYSSYQSSISEPINKYVSYTSISVQTVSPVLSTHFIDKVIGVITLSAILSVILVFFFFGALKPILTAFDAGSKIERFVLLIRAFTPSIAVLTGAFCDIVIALGAMSLFNIPLTLPSFAALMMLVGYSLDTDILLTTRILKRRGNPRDNAYDAMKTGLTMSVTGMVAFGALFILSIMTHIPTYYEISAVALAGLVGDMFATWGINAVMILHYAEKREKQ